MLQLLVIFSSNFQTISLMFGELREPYVFFLTFGPMIDMSKLTIGHPFFQLHCIALPDAKQHFFLKVSHCIDR